MKLRLATAAVLGLAAACGIFGVIDRAIEPRPKPRPVARLNIFERQRIAQDRALVGAHVAQPVHPYPAFQDCLLRSLANDDHTDATCGHDAGRWRALSTHRPEPPSGDELTAALRAMLRDELMPDPTSDVRGPR